MAATAPPTLPGEARTFAARLSLYYAAVFSIYGTQLPFLPVWLDARGLGATEIGLIGAAPLFVRIVATPAVAYIADRSGDHRRVIVVLGWAGLAALLALTGARAFWPILLLVLVTTLATSTVMPLTETLAMSGVRRWRLDYGRMRLWGSVSFIVASLAGGLAVERWGAEAAVWLIAVGAALTALAAHRLPRPTGTMDGTEPSPARRRITTADVAALATSPRFLLFLLAVGSVQAAHAVFYTFGVLHWRAQGLSGTWTGGLWAIGVVAEIGLFARSAVLVERLGAVGLIAAGAAASAIRWAAMSLDPSLAWLMPLQMLHAITFAATHIGAVHFISEEIAPERAGTAQALYASVTAGIAMGGATLLAGSLYASQGGRAYLAMALLGGIGLVAALVLKAR